MPTLQWKNKCNAMFYRSPSFFIDEPRSFGQVARGHLWLVIASQKAQNPQTDAVRFMGCTFEVCVESFFGCMYYYYLLYVSVWVCVCVCVCVVSIVILVRVKRPAKAAKAAASMGELSLLLLLLTARRRRWSFCTTAARLRLGLARGWSWGWVVAAFRSH